MSSLSQAAAALAGRTDAPASPTSWHDAGSVESSSGPYQQTVVSEAGVVYYGMQPVRKPQRVVYTSGPGPGSCSSGSEHAGSLESASADSPRVEQLEQPIQQLEVVQGCVQTEREQENAL